jgi:hypothetical protein
MNDYDWYLWGEDEELVLITVTLDNKGEVIKTEQQIIKKGDVAETA